MFEGKLTDHIKVDVAYDAGTATKYDGTAQAMIDMRDYDGCAVFVIGTTVAATTAHLVTGFKIVSNTTSTGGGTDHDIAEAVTTDGGTTETLAKGHWGTGTNGVTPIDTCFGYLDIKADDMYAGDRYIAAMTTGVTGTIPYMIVYIRYRGKYSFKDMVQTTRTMFQYTGDLS